MTKPKFYYDKYRYRATLYHQDFHYARYAKNEKQLKEAISYRVRNGGYFFHGRIDTDFTNVNINVPLAFLNWRNANNNRDITIRVDYNMISVYGNDLEKLKTLESIGPTVEYVEVIQMGDPDILLRHNPKHQYRTYFRSRTLSDDFHEELGKFLIAYDKSISPCGSLHKWAFDLNPRQNWKKRYLEPNFFVEYDNESFQTVLALSFGKYLGKTYKV